MRQRGQSLVEMAIIAPILILLFLGVFEVGYALRGYMVLLNASREATRFLARGRYTDGEGIAHFQDAIAGQLEVVPGQNATIFVHHGVMCAGSPFTEGDEEWEYRRTVEGELLDTRVVGDTLRAEMIPHNDQANLALYAREVASALAGGDAARHAALLAHDFEAAPVDWACEELVAVEVPYLHSQLIGLFGGFRLPMRVETAMRVVTTGREQ